jgi:uncharacterized protein (DUF433 family)
MVDMTQTVPGFPRFTLEPDKLGGQPCVRGYRFGVAQLLDMIASGRDFESIHIDFPFIERADVAEALRYAAALARRSFFVAVPA